MRVPSHAISSIPFILVLLSSHPTFAARLPYTHSLYRDVHARTKTAVTTTTKNVITNPPSDIPLLGPQININSGGSAGGRFIAEHPRWIVGTTDSFSNLKARIGGAEPQNLLAYATNRFGVASSVWGYDLPVSKPGLYDCTAHFAEIEFSAFQPRARVFDLTIAGGLSDIRTFSTVDVYADLGGAEFTAFTKTALSLTVQGILSIRLVPVLGDAFLAGITCERVGDLPAGMSADYTIPQVSQPTAIQSAILPSPELTLVDPSSLDSVPPSEININCGGPSLGRFDADSTAFVDGNTSIFTVNTPIGGAEKQNEPALRSHRYGLDGTAFAYHIPVPTPGVYECTLHFAEIFSGSFASGARVFDLDVMGTVIPNIDVYKEAGDAEFTSVVKTFTGLHIDTDLVVTLIPLIGNAFVSAVTCIQTDFLPDATAEPESNSPAVAASSEPPLFEFPSPTISAEADADALSPTETVNVTPVPTSTMISIPVSPDMEIPTPIPSDLATFPTSSPIFVPLSPEPSLTPEPMVPSYSGEVSPSVIDATSEVIPTDENESPGSSSVEPSEDQGENEPSPSLAETDSPLRAGAGQNVTTYFLRAVVNNTGVFSEKMKDTLKTVSAESHNVSSSWALVRLNRAPASGSTRVSIFVRQTNATEAYDLELQARYKEEDISRAESTYRDFVDDGDATGEMVVHGFNNVDLRLRDGQTEAKASDDSGTDTSLIVIVTVLAVLAVLVAIAVLAFFASSRWKKRLAGADFDGPPPVLSESDASSDGAPSELAASVEYLDDDSTYTAATSRAGEHVDQVSYVRDAFGRGAATVDEDGIHGLS